ncbi:Tim44/TimA family putative adaptor protein [Maricaulis sp. CAU 1757]
MIELLSTLIFGGIAVFFAIRLYTVLGRREGHMEAPASQDVENKRVARDNAATTLRPAFEGPAAAGLESIAAADRGFDPDVFLGGARSAYTMIVTAFAKGDRDTLQPLLSDTVYTRYVNAINARETKGHTVTTEIERIRSAEITEASLDNDLARIKVRFDAEIATETRDAEKQHVSGDLGQLSTVREDWVFERRLSSNDPNWVLARVAAA